MNKICNKCRIEKDVEFFNKNKATKDGYRHECKDCRRINNSKYKEKIKESNKIFRENNKEYYKKYYEENKEAIDLYKKEYKESNSDKLKESATEYRLANKDKINEYKREYRKNNKEKYKEYYLNSKETTDKYMEENRDKIRLVKNKYFRERKKTDILFKIGCSIRCLIGSSFKRKGFRKNSKTSIILGCDFAFFRSYIESKFEDWMTWDNYGKYNGEFNIGWDIDHIVPISSAKSEEEILLLNHYTNLQPLCCKTNREIKKDSIN